MRKIILALPLLMIFAGCAVLSHLDQLLTLQSYSEDKVHQAAFVRKQNQAFEALLKTVENGSLKQYKNQHAIRTKFGEPLFVKSIVVNGKPMTEWMYRYSTRYFDSKKVYFYFDEKGLLQQWEIVAIGGIPQIEKSEQR